MKKYAGLLVCFLLTGNLSLFPQKSVTDSLKNIVLTTRNDTLKAITLNDLFWEYSYTDLKTAKNYADQSLAFSRKIGYKKGEGSALNSLGTFFEQTGDYKKALNSYLRAMEIFDSLHRYNSLAIVYSNIAIIYKVLGNYNVSMDYNLKALEIKEKNGNKLDLADSYNNIGSLYGMMKKDDKSLEYNFKALAIRKEIEDKRGIAYSLNNIAELYRGRKEYRKAIETYNQSKNVLKEVKDEVGIATVYANTGAIYKDQKNFPDAIRNMDLALKAILKTHVKERITYMYQKLGETYYEMGDFNRSAMYYELCNKEAQSIGHKDMLKDSYYYLSEIASKRNRFKEAFLYHKKYSELNDTLQSEINSKQITELEVRYETEKKDHEIQILHQTYLSQQLMIDKRNQWIIFISVLLILVLLLSVLIYRFIHFKNKQQLINTVLETENAERLRIAKDMHDELGSSLSKIQLYSGIALQNLSNTQLLEEHMKRISASVNDLTGHMRDLIWAMNPENSVLENLLAHIREYCSEFLEEFPLEYALNFPDIVPAIKLSQKVQRNIYLVVKESLNNVVKHAQATFISIDVRIFDDMQIHFFIRDNGKGFSPEHIQRKGNGLFNMHDRIEKIGGNYRLDSEPGKGTRIDFSVGLNSSQITSK